MKLRDNSKYYVDRIGSRKFLSILSKVFKLENFEILQRITRSKLVQEKL